MEEQVARQVQAVAGRDTQRITAAVLQDAAEYVILVKHPNILHRIGLLSRRRVITIQPIVLGTLLKIAREMIDFSLVDAEAFERPGGTVDFLDMGIKNIIQNNDRLVNVIAFAAVNCEADPPPGLMRFLRDNLTPKEGREILSLIVDKMDVMDFLACTVLASRTVIARTGRTEEQTSGDLSAA